MSLRSRVPWVCLDYGRLRADAHHLLLERADDLLEIPASSMSVLLLEPGVSVTHEAIKICSENEVRIFWVGEGLTRLYGVSLDKANPQRILQQAAIHTNTQLRIEAARRLYRKMFNEDFPPAYSIEKLRGLEGFRVKTRYKEIATSFKLHWDSKENCSSELSACIGFATSCLYAISEVVISVLGYTPCIGVVHSGDSRSLVFDLADTVKFQEVVPIAFEIFSKHQDKSISELNPLVRHACRDSFWQTKLFDRLIENLQFIMDEPCS